MEKTFNTTPKNELEVRLICVDMAMQIVQNGNIDKTDTILDSANKLYKFVTRDESLTVNGVQDVVNSMMPLFETIMKGINPEAPEVVEPIMPEVAVVAEDAPADKSPKSTKK